MKLKKLWPLIGALCVSLVGSAYAETHQYGGPPNENMPQTDQGTYQRGSYREITPNAGPRVSHGADVYITADFIYLKAAQDGIDYANTGSADTLAAFTNAAKGKQGTVGTHWEPGFKAGLGLNFNHDGWDIRAQYTWLNAHDKDTTKAHTSDPQGVFVHSLAYANNALKGSRANAQWHLNFNVIDLELGRNFYLSQFLTMRPFIGLKGTWQRQDIHVKLIGTGLAFADKTAVTGPYRSHHQADAWGIGVRGGFNLSWYMTKSWSLYGNFAWASMWADTNKSTQVETFEDTATSPATKTTVYNNSNPSYYSVKYVGECELGLRWETWFSDDNYHFAIHAGWEQHVWLNWSQVFGKHSNPSHDLNFHGLSLRFRFDF